MAFITEQLRTPNSLHSDNRDFSQPQGTEPNTAFPEVLFQHENERSFFKHVLKSKNPILSKQHTITYLKFIKIVPVGSCIFLTVDGSSFTLLIHYSHKQSAKQKQKTKPNMNSFLGSFLLPGMLVFWLPVTDPELKPCRPDPCTGLLKHKPRLCLCIFFFFKVAENISFFLTLSKYEFSQIMGIPQ